MKEFMKNLWMNFLDIGFALYPAIIVVAVFGIIVLMYGY